MTRLSLNLMASLLIAGTGLLISLIFVWTAHETQPEEKTPVTKIVRTLRVSPSNQTIRVETQGTVIPARRVEMVPQVKGRVVEQNDALVPGGALRAGDRLIRIDPSDYELALIEQQTALAEATFEHEVEQGHLSVVRKKPRRSEPADGRGRRDGSHRGQRHQAVFSSENQPPLTVARAVRRLIEREKLSLPATVGVTLSQDRSEEYRERLQLLLVNGAFGLMLVLLALGLFLELRVAFWTALGIPVSILGSLTLLPVLDSSINMISLFGFIVTLGIVVDDAVVVGEDIFHKISEGMPRLEAAVAGVREMTIPIVFAVSTNIIAFLPLLFVPGEAGQFFNVLPAVVIAVFTVSLVVGVDRGNQYPRRYFLSDCGTFE